MHLAPLLAASTLVPAALLVARGLATTPTARTLLPLALVVVTLAAAVGMAGPDGVPDAFLLVLREGREGNVIEALGSRDPWLPAVGPPGLPLRERVWLHAVEAVVACGLLLGITRTRAGWGAALAVTTATALSPLALHAVRSESPGVPLSLLTLLGGAFLGATGAAHRLDRGLALLGLALATSAGATLRPEMALVGVAAVVAGALRALERDREIPEVPALAAVLVLSIAGIGLAPEVLAPLTDVFPRAEDGPSEVRRQVASLAALPQLLGLAPSGLAALAVLGWARVRSVSEVVLAAAALTLLRLLAEASHVGDAPYETLRYGGMLVGLLALYAAEGARWLGAWLGPRAALGWVLVALSTVAPRPSAPWEIDDLPWVSVRTTQTEGARFLLQVQERWPDCLVVTREAVQSIDLRSPQAVQTFQWSDSTRGGPLGWSRNLHDDDAVRAALVHVHVPIGSETPGPWAVARATGRCVLFVVGLDCQLAGSGCDALTADLPVLWEQTVDVPEHNTHHGGREGPMSLRVHAVVAPRESEP